MHYGMTSRTLSHEERSLAFKVFENRIDYDRVSISSAAIGNQVITTHFNGWLTIHWRAGFMDIMSDEGRKATFIHEMTHVWQGNNNGRWTGTYQAKSVAAQTSAGVRDILQTRDYKGAIKNWDTHRGKAYLVDVSQIGDPWSSFNVEQQGTIVESWYVDEALRRRLGNYGNGIFGAGMSPYDARFPYIRDVIRKRGPKAAYRPVELPKGGDQTIKQIQDKLVALRYLAPRYADGLVGAANSATLDAVRAFQSRNGLTPDRDLGGPNSKTRQALQRPVDQLQPAP